MGQVPERLGMYELFEKSIKNAEEKRRRQKGVKMLHFLISAGLLYVLIPLEHILSLVGISLWG